MISQQVKAIVESPENGVIRKMFEEGALLKKKYGEENVFDFSIGNPDLDPPEEVYEQVLKVASDKTHLRHGYMPNPGFLETRAAMAEKTSIEQGVKVGAENVIMSCGAAGAINCTLRAIINPGDDVLIPCPFFAEYTHYVHNFGANVVKVKTKDDFSLDCDEIKKHLSNKTAAILINSPNNPTGKIYSQEEIKELCTVLSEHAKKTGRAPYLILDEPYRAITYDGKTVAAAFPHYEYSVVVTSFAKNLSLPGERIGYICINPACPEKDDFVKAAIFATRTLGFVNAPSFFQKVLSTTWNAKCDYSAYEKRRNQIMQVMNYAGLKYIRPEGAFYLWVKVPDDWNDDDMAFTEHLKKYNILCAPGSGFAGKGWFRIAYCCSEKSIINSKEAFKKAVSKIEK